MTLRMRLTMRLKTLWLDLKYLINNQRDLNEYFKQPSLYYHDPKDEENWYV